MVPSAFFVVMVASIVHYIVAVPLFVYRYKQMAFPVNGHSLPLVLLSSVRGLDMDCCLAVHKLCHA